jgi:6-O-methylguanine DNA methyltransferase, DNA binding domain
VKSKFKSRTSWREKLEKPQEPKLVNVPPKMSRFGSGTMLIPTPLLVDDVIRKVPKGKLVTVSEIRRKLAREFSADVTCPLTTGIFIRIAAEAAEEDRINGRKRVTPYWRVVKDDGSLNPKFPGGPAQQTSDLRAEGFTVVPNGKKAPVVKEFERRLFKLK